MLIGTLESYEGELISEAQQDDTSVNPDLREAQIVDFGSPSHSNG